jgi:hypothetical protein
MANNYYELLSQIDAARAQLADALASDRPGDVAAAQILSEHLADLERELFDLQRASEVGLDEAFARLQGFGGEPLSLAATMVTPDVIEFDETVTAERIYAVADLYFIYMHERLGVFDVTLELQSQFQSGRLKVSKGDGAQRLYRFDRRRALQYTRNQRHQAYRRVFGYYPKVAPPRGAQPFDEFHAMFSGFNKRVAAFSRDKRVAQVIKGSQPQSEGFGSIAIVRRSGLDLRNKLKTASYGHVHVLTIEVAQLLRSAFEILDAPDIRNLYGAKDPWDVIEEVSMKFLGRQTWASQRNRMAVTGRDVLRWLAGGAILNTSRPQFEFLLTEIEESCEEWLTSEAAVRSRQVAIQPAAKRSNVVAMARKATG